MEAPFVEEEAHPETPQQAEGQPAPLEEPIVDDHPQNHQVVQNLLLVTK